MLGYKLTKDENTVEIPKFNIGDFNTREDALAYLEMLYVDGAITKDAYKSYRRKVNNTRAVIRYIKW